MGSCGTTVGNGRGLGTGVAGIGVGRGVGVGGRGTGVGERTAVRVAVALRSKRVGETTAIGPTVVVAIAIGVPASELTIVPVSLCPGALVAVGREGGWPSTVGVFTASGVTVGMAVSTPVGVGVCSDTRGRQILCWKMV